MKKIVAAFCALVLLSACGQKVPPYKYQATLDSAYLAGTASEEKRLGLVPKYFMFPKLIDGKGILKRPIDIFVTSSAAAAAIAANRPVGIALAPGQHRILACFAGGNGGIAQEFLLDAKAGERYFLKANVLWDEKLLAPDFPQAVSYWVENAAKEVIIPAKTVRPVYSSGGISACGSYYVGE